MSIDLKITSMEVNRENLERYKEAFEKNDMPMPLPKLQWQHDHYLKRSFISWIIDDNNCIAGLYSSFFVDFLAEGNRKAAAQSIDTLTDINYRGKGLFTKLASDVNKRLADAGTPFIYGFPNSSSAPGFFKKLGWQKIGDGSVPFLVRPIRFTFFLKKLMKAKESPAKPLQTATITHDKIRAMKDFNDGRVNALAETFLSGKKYAVCRDSNYLNWRFVEKPDEQYSLYGYYESGVLKGFVVFTVKQKHGGNIGYIMDLIYDPQEGKTGKALLKFAVKAMKQSGADLVLAWNFKESPNRPAFKSNLFFIMPEKLKTIQLFFGACLFDGSIDKAAFFNAANWYISYCDSDTV
ncbi:MAG TPA: GNAT family N-acetyltransferase [Ferruginibacter sp.]|nr:GNAT family N-acetyltransferase [Ferruginibacter sp.]